MVALLLMILGLAAGCRSSSIAQAPLVEPPDDIWSAEEIDGFMATKERLDTEADPPPTQYELNAMLNYLDYSRHYYRWVLAGAQLSGGRLDYLPRPEELWTNEQINQVGETLYRIQVGEQPPPTLAQIGAMQEFEDYYQLYNEWLLQQSGGEPAGDLPPFMEAPWQIWTNEQVIAFSETKYRLDTGDDPAPTQQEIDAMQEYFDYYELYNEYLLAQQG